MSAMSYIRRGSPLVLVLLAGCGGAVEAPTDEPATVCAYGELDETGQCPPPVCALKGDYIVTYLPAAGCGYPNKFPARVELREVECETPEQHCEPGVPTARCDFTRELGGVCTARVIWERKEAN